MERDIVVVGVGPVGSSLTRRLAEAGHSVVCFGPDVGQPPFSSHDDSGRLTRILDPSTVWARLAARSISGYRDIETRSGIRFHHPVGVLWSAHSEPPLRELDEVRNLFDVETSTGLGGWENLIVGAGASTVLERGSAGYIAPREMVRAHRALGGAAGAVFDPRVVRSVEPRAGRWSIRLDDGAVVLADRLVIAAGAGTPALVEVDFTVTGEVVIDASIADADGERLASAPCIGRLGVDGFLVEGYLTPPIRGEHGWSIKFGAEIASSELASADDVGEWMLGDAHRDQMPELTAALRALLPGIEFGPMRSRPCMYTRTPTGLPVVDEISPGLVVVAGGNGRMAKSADAVAALAAQLVTDGTWTDQELTSDLFSGR